MEKIRVFQLALAVVVLTIVLSPATAGAGGEFCQWCIFENCENTGYGFDDCWIQSIPTRVCLDWDWDSLIPHCDQWVTVYERICRTSGNCDFIP